MRRESARVFPLLRRRLTLVCTLATGIILAGMAFSCLAFAQGLLEKSGETGFQGAFNAVLFHVRSQTNLDHTWISQTEASGNLMLQITLSGRPLLYRGAVGGEDRDYLLALAQENARLEGLDPSATPEGGARSEQIFFRFSDSGGQVYRAAAARLPLEEGWAGILLVQSLAEEERVLLVQRGAFALFTVLALGLLGLFAWMFTGRLLRPLEESRRRQAEFVHAASHELRSPLAVIRASLSALKGAPPDRAEHFADLAEGECLRMTRLVGDMLTLSRADDGAWTIHRDDVEPDTLLLGVYERYEAPARQRGLRLTIDLPEEALPVCRWDRERVEQVLSILTDNAVAYTLPGGVIHLEISAQNGQVRLAVADNGPGIPPEQREQVFERFYRGDVARSDREHSGLGLAIAAELVALHRGKLELTETAGGGATFTVTLPTA